MRGKATLETVYAIAIARACIRGGARGRFYTVVDLVNRLESEARSGRQGRLADYLIRLDFVVLDELGYLPFAQAGGQLLFHLISRLYERTSIVSPITARSSRPATSPGASRTAPEPSSASPLPGPHPRLAQVGKQAPPARAAPSLERALYVARGSLLFATWTSHHNRKEGSPFARRSGGRLRAD